MEFNNLIKQLRLDKKLSQTELAKELNLNQTTISMWELGKKLPDYNNLVKLSKFFDVTADVLLGLSEK